MLSKLSFMNEFSINQLVTVTETKQIAEMLPGILNQLGPDSLTHLKRLATAAVPDMNADAAADDDDEVPDLVENFDEVSKDETATTPAVEAEATKEE